MFGLKSVLPRPYLKLHDDLGSRADLAEFGKLLRQRRGPRVKRFYANLAGLNERLQRRLLRMWLGSRRHHSTGCTGNSPLFNKK